MIDLDNEIIEMVVALESIAAVIGAQPSRLVVVAALGIFTPRILGPDPPAGQGSGGAGVGVGAPPQSPRPEDAFRRPPVTLAFVGNDAAAAKGDRNWPPCGD